MKSAVEPRLRERLKEQPVSARDWPTLHCHQRTLQRLLTKLHAEGEVHIVGWRTAEKPGPYSPVYAKGKGRDKPYPKPPSPNEKQRRRRQRPDVAEREVLLRRAQYRRKHPLGLSLSELLTHRKNHENRP